MNNFYVYFHINPLKNEVFYVGKGKKDRAYQKGNRSKYWKNLVNKYSYIIDIVDSNLTEDEAFEKEKFYIKFIGRRDLGLGPLVNMTDGGDGTSGSIRVHSDETKARMSIAAKRQKGKKKTWVVSDETRAKIGAAHTGSKKSDEARQKMRDNHNYSVNRQAGMSIEALRARAAKGHETMRRKREMER